MEELDPQMKQLLESFVALCDTLVEKAFVVTNGIKCAGIVLQESLAQHIRRKIVATYKEEERAKADKEWHVCSVPQTMQYSFEQGYNEAMKQVMENQRRMTSSREEVSSAEEKLAQDNIVEIKTDDNAESNEKEDT